MPPQTPFSLPDHTSTQLSGLVSRIEANPGAMIRPGEFDELQGRVNVRRVRDNLPEGLDEEDLAGILCLALLTECATETYTRIFEDAARRWDAPWLGHFAREVWTPDELTHADPYKIMLLDLGFAEGDLDRDVAETQQRGYPYASGDTPFHLTVFGMFQEYLTDNWHGLIANLLRRGSPEAAWMATRIKRRETLHTLWYRDMTALQLEGNPALLPGIAETLLAFKMPGNSLVPDLQAAVPGWLPPMGADFDRIRQDLIRLVHSAVDDVSKTGELVLHFAAARGDKLGPLSTRHLRAAIGALGGAGQGLLGEALLERAGLGYMYRHGSASRGAAGQVGRLRGLLRSWIAERIDLEFKPYGA